MLFGLFGESDREKELRLRNNDLENEIGRLKASQNGTIFFGSRFVDDDRNLKNTKVNNDNDYKSFDDIYAEIVRFGKK